MATPAKPTTLLLKHFHHPRFTTLKPTSTTISKKPPTLLYISKYSTQPSTPPPPSLLPQLLSLPRTLRYTIYTAFGLAVLAESTFWANVVYYKFLATTEEERRKGEEFWSVVGEAVGRARGNWLGNYRGWWGAGVWGL